MTDSKEDGLKPCPFCNGPAALWEERDGYYVGCGKGVNDCAVHPRMKAGLNTWQPSAIAAWNRRASSPPVGGSGEVPAEAIARAQETLNNAKVTGENPTSQRALEYRLGELLNLLAVSPALVSPQPIPSGTGEDANA